jgi:hypothetical protein
MSRKKNKPPEKRIKYSPPAPPQKKTLRDWLKIFGFWISLPAVIIITLLSWMEKIPAILPKAEMLTPVLVEDTDVFQSAFLVRNKSFWNLYDLHSEWEPIDFHADVGNSGVNFQNVSFDLGPTIPRLQRGRATQLRVPYNIVEGKTAGFKIIFTIKYKIHLFGFSVPCQDMFAFKSQAGKKSGKFVWLEDSP